MLGRVASTSSCRLTGGAKSCGPAGNYSGQSSTYRVFLIIRSLPQGGDMNATIARIRTVKVRPLNPPADWSEPTWTDVGERSFDATPITWEKTLKFWDVLHLVNYHVSPDAIIANKPTRKSGCAKSERPCRVVGWRCWNSKRMKRTS
jgi:hypothetical protein